MADVNVITKCPKCGDDLVRRKYVKDGVEREFLSHANYNKDAEERCDFNFWLNFLGTNLNDDQVKELIETGKTKKPVTIKMPLKYESGKVSMDFSGLRK